MKTSTMYLQLSNKVRWAYFGIWGRTIELATILPPYTVTVTDISKD